MPKIPLLFFRNPIHASASQRVLSMTHSAEQHREQQLCRLSRSAGDLPNSWIPSEQQLPMFSPSCLLQISLPLPSHVNSLLLFQGVFFSPHVFSNNDCWAPFPASERSQFLNDLYWGFQEHRYKYSFLKLTPKLSYTIISITVTNCFESCMDLAVKGRLGSSGRHRFYAKAARGKKKKNLQRTKALLLR